MLYVPCICHVYCSQTYFVLVSFKEGEIQRFVSIDPKKRYEYMTIDIQFKLIINPLNIKNLYDIENYLNGIYYIGLNTK